MPTFKEMLDSKNDAELGAMCRDRYERLMDAHAAGISDEHPVAGFNRDSAILRQHRVAKDGDPGNVASSKEIERADHAADDPPPTPGSAGTPQRSGAALAAHDRARVIEELHIRESGTSNLEAELHLARVRHANVTPESVRAMTAAVPGYGRLK